MSLMGQVVVQAFSRRKGETTDEYMLFIENMADILAQDVQHCVQVDLYYNYNRGFFEFCKNDPMELTGTMFCIPVETHELLDSCFAFVAKETHDMGRAQGRYIPEESMWYDRSMKVGDVLYIRSRDSFRFCGAFAASNTGWQTLPGRDLYSVMPNVILD